MANLTSNRVFAWIIFAIVFYAILRVSIPLPTLASILNGVLWGMGVALVIAYFQLIKHSIFGYGNSFDRANQYALGDAVLWLSVFIGLSSSIYLRINDDAPSSVAAYVVAQRYLAIFAAIIQITAPDFGKSIFYGRDRRLMIVAGVVGLTVALILIWLQI